MQVLYLFSDLAYFIIYHIAKYRKEIVLQNLAIAFPEKTEEERLKIARQFYRNFTDNFIETIKFISAGKQFFQTRFSGNFEIFSPFYTQGRKCQVLLAHNFNWEMGNLALPILTPFQLLTVYMPLSSKVMERLFLYIRSRTGAILLPATKMREAFIPYRNRQYLLALVADQNPGNPKNAYWMKFFGRPTPFVKGPEKNARANNTVVMFAFIAKKKRGYYNTQIILAETDPNQLPETDLTKKYVTYLEEVIRSRPDMWLWSHRRWKHEWKPEYGPVIE